MNATPLRKPQLGRIDPEFRRLRHLGRDTDVGRRPHPGPAPRRPRSGDHVEPAVERPRPFEARASARAVPLHRG